MNCVLHCKKSILLIAAIALLLPITLNTAYGQQDKIGVIFVIHGGMAEYKPQLMWDAAVLQFSFDHNHSVYKLVNWNRDNWSMILDTDTTDFALKYIKLFEFEYERIGGVDPFNTLSFNQLQDMKDELDANPYGLTFEVDWAGFQCADQPGKLSLPPVHLLWSRPSSRPPR